MDQKFCNYVIKIGQNVSKYKIMEQLSKKITAFNTNNYKTSFYYAKYKTWGQKLSGHLEIKATFKVFFITKRWKIKTSNISLKKQIMYAIFRQKIWKFRLFKLNKTH